jgi:hypothetical protein
MTLPTSLTAIVEALRSAGATEEIIARAIKARTALRGNAPICAGLQKKWTEKIFWPSGTTSGRPVMPVNGATVKACYRTAREAK